MNRKQVSNTKKAYAKRNRENDFVEEVLSTFLANEFVQRKLTKPSGVRGELGDSSRDQSGLLANLPSIVNGKAASAINPQSSHSSGD